MACNARSAITGQFRVSVGCGSALWMFGLRSSAVGWLRGEVAGLEYAVAAFRFDLAVPGDADAAGEPAVGVEVAGFDPVVDDVGADFEALGCLLDGDLADAEGVQLWEVVGVAGPGDGFGVVAAAVAGGVP